MLFDGKPEAAEQAEVGAAQRKAASRQMSASGWSIPAAPTTPRSSPRATTAALGRARACARRTARRSSTSATWHSAVASRKNDDGTTSFVSIDPTVDGFNFVVGARDGKRALIMRDGQHEYVFVEAVP